MCVHPCAREGVGVDPAAELVCAKRVVVFSCVQTLCGVLVARVWFLAFGGGAWEDNILRACVLGIWLGGVGMGSRKKRL